MHAISFGEIQLPTNPISTPATTIGVFYYKCSNLNGGVSKFLLPSPENLNDHPPFFPAGNLTERSRVMTGDRWSGIHRIIPCATGYLSFWPTSYIYLATMSTPVLFDDVADLAH